MKKKIFSLVLIAVMVLSSFATVFAGSTVTITPKDGMGDHTYTAYQIFKGTYEGTSDEIKNIEWADGVDVAGFVADLKAIEGTTVFADLDATKTDAASAVAAAAAIQEYYGTTFDSEKARALAEVVKDNVATAAVTNQKGGVTVENKGFYLIEDTTEALAKEDSYSRYILMNIKGDEAVTIKADVVKSDKKVKETNDTTGDVSDWQDAADYDIGDAVPFKLSATLPANYADYKTYSLWFCDEQSKGLTFNADSVEVFIDGNKMTTGYEVVTEGVAPLTFIVKIPELVGTAATKGSVISVEYTSTLNADAERGVTGNPNKSYVKYSNNPNNDQQGEPEGTTPDDKVIVFTYDIVAKKVGDDGETALEGAGFTLYKEVPADYVAKTGETVVEDGGKKYLQIGDEITGVTTFEFEGKDAGTYKLVETTVPAGYTKADDIVFTVTATYTATADEPKLESLTVDPSDAFVVNTTTYGDVTTTVQNLSGSVLPETGGMGTTIIYILGAALVIGAGVVLVSRKKTNDR